MGVIIKECNCEKRKDVEEHSNGQTKEIPKSLIDIGIDLQNFVRQRNENVFDIYEKLQHLGNGAYGDVYKVKRKNDNEIRALKEIKKSLLEKVNNYSDIKNEINILKKIDHPNVLKIYEFFEDEKRIYIIMEFCNEGDLFDKTDDCGTMSEFAVKYIMYQVFLAINVLHMKKVVHGDIKTDNIAFMKKKEETEINGTPQNNKKEKNIFKILNEEKSLHKEILQAKNIYQLSPKALNLVKELAKYEVKLVDFGCAKMKKKNDINKKLSGIIGTDFYCSPEVVKNNYDYECDEWAWGVMMYILLSGFPPFDGNTEEEIFEKVLNDNPDLDIPEFKYISNSCKNLISKLLDKNPNKRIKSADALNDEFFTKGINIGNLLAGKETENEEILKNFAKKKSKRFGGNEKKNSKFKDAVIAYITLNFVDKEQEKKVNEIYRQLSLDDEKHIITKKTFNEKLKKTFSQLTQEEIDQLFNDLDDNNNEEIEYHELIKGLSDQKYLLNEKNLKEAFNFFDSDSSGDITWNEIANVIFGGKNIPENIISQFLEEIGQKDQNLAINFEEFKKIILDE
jgi:calcium-dependent protein kinase